METHQTTDLGIAGSIPAGLVFLYNKQQKKKKERRKERKKEEKGKGKGKTKKERMFLLTTFNASMNYKKDPYELTL